MRRVLLGVTLLVAAAFAADRDLAGGFAGEWKSGASGNSGAIHFTLENEGGTWKSTFVFALDGADVPCTMRSVKLQDGKVELVYDAEVQNTVIRNTVKGEWTGAEFRGTYAAATADGNEVVDTGTWTAKRTR